MVILFTLIISLFLSLTPSTLFTEATVNPPKTSTEMKKEEINLQWEKIDEGLYQFTYSSDITKVSENEKLQAFLTELTKFKKDQSNEKIIGYQPLIDDNKSTVNGYLVSTEKKSITGAVLAAIITGIVTGLIGLGTLIYTIRNNKKTLFVNNITSERVKWMGLLKEYVAEFISLASFYNEKTVFEDAKLKGEYLDKVIHAKAKISLHLNYRGNSDKEIMALVDKMTNNIMKAYDVFALIKKSDKEKVTYVLEKHKKQLDKRIMLKIEESIKATPKSELLPDYKTGLKKVKYIIQEAQNEEIALFNDKFKKEFKSLKTELQTNTDTLLKLCQKYLKEEWNRVKEEAEKGNITKR
jgi:hypothetical protein